VVKGLRLFGLLLVLLAAPVTARAQVFGQYMGAEIVPVGGHLFGGYLQASQDQLGLLGQLRLSFYPGVDFGFHGGLTRIQVGSGDRTSVRIGSDVKFQLAARGSMLIAAGGALGVETGDDFSVLTIGPTVVVSQKFPMGSGGITPYGGLGLLFSNLDVLGEQDTDFSVPFRFGAEFEMAPELKIVTEIQLRASDQVNDDFSLAIGVNLPF
jgi:hypothetical protein